ncbi:MAG: manganese efflux pump [Candidatus Omnitrophica bacterium]|nr:manganese efflux pump [Candidatus Omnitrophota bacterium]
MSSWQIIVTAVALGCDAFSVALCVGSHKRFPGQKFRLGFHFGLFQMVMFLLGFGVGRIVVDWVRAFDHWIASILVGMVAFHMLIEAFNRDEESEDIDYSRGWYLVSLSIATSIDAMAVGFALGLTGISPFTSSFIIGIAAGLMTLIGLSLGRRLRSKIGRMAEVGGGIILLIIAVKLFQI